MLLLVMQTEFEQRRGLSPRRLARSLDEAGNCRADMVAIGADDIDRSGATTGRARAAGDADRPPRNRN